MPPLSLIYLLIAVISAAGLTVLLIWLVPGPGAFAAAAGIALLARLAMMVWRR